MRCRCANERCEARQDNGFIVIIIIIPQKLGDETQQMTKKAECRRRHCRRPYRQRGTK